MLIFSANLLNRGIVSLILLITYLFIIPQLVLAQNWQYPLERTLERASYKEFGQYIDKNFYVGKENLFPGQYVGYHAGVDLEILPNELNQNVPVIAVTGGIISYVGFVSGYGGVILEKLGNEGLTVLYGHLKLSPTNLKAGDSVKSGQTLANLGNAFSSETGGERKHLHFGMYKGTDLYFKGYENTEAELSKRWINPLIFLQSKITISPTISQIFSPTPVSIEKSGGIVSQISIFINNLLNRLHSLVL